MWAAWHLKWNRAFATEEPTGNPDPATVVKLQLASWGCALPHLPGWLTYLEGKSTQAAELPSGSLKLLASKKPSRLGYNRGKGVTIYCNNAYLWIMAWLPYTPGVWVVWVSHTVIGKGSSRGKRTTFQGMNLVLVWSMCYISLACAPASLTIDHAVGSWSPTTSVQFPIPAQLWPALKIRTIVSPVSPYLPLKAITSCLASVFIALLRGEGNKKESKELVWSVFPFTELYLSWFNGSLLSHLKQWYLTVL